MQAGLICYPGQGTIDGVAGNHVLLAPPYIISDSEIDMLVTRLEPVVNGTCAMAAASSVAGLQPDRQKFLPRELDLISCTGAKLRLESICMRCSTCIADHVGS